MIAWSAWFDKICYFDYYCPQFSVYVYAICMHVQMIRKCTVVHRNIWYFYLKTKHANKRRKELHGPILCCLKKLKKLTKAKVKVKM